MKKGFTLIELLAVIVILAIIALIATPIILGIINDARKESNERSVELYASAVRNAVAAYQLIHSDAPKSFDDLTIEYDGDVKCTTQELYSDGNFYIAGCTVNGVEVDYTYGEQQVTQIYKPQYYSYLEFWGTVGETEAPLNPSSVPPTDNSFYMGYDVTDGVVSASYVCCVRNNTEYCLKGGDDTIEVYEKNKTVLKEVYADVLDTNACSFDKDADFDAYASVCNFNGLAMAADTMGFVEVQEDSVICEVTEDGNFTCY